MLLTLSKKKTNYYLRLPNQFKYAYHISSQKGRLQRSRLSFELFMFPLVCAAFRLSLPIKICLKKCHAFIKKICIFFSYTLPDA